MQSPRPHTTGEVIKKPPRVGVENPRKRFGSENQDNFQRRQIKSEGSQRTVEFIDKIRFSARVDTSWRRSRHYCPPTKTKHVDIWTLKPPNFNPQAFLVKPPERNSREAIRPERYETESSVLYKELSVPAADRKRNRRREEELRDKAKEATTIHLPKSKLNRRPPFQLRFHINKPDEAKIEFVKVGCYKQDPYEMPKPHDFRQYPPIRSLGLPEFLTSQERDPMAIKFKSKHLKTITGPSLQIVQRDVEPGSGLDLAAQRPEKWDSELILPKLPFPNKMNAYSRHRRMDRSARSAFLERAEVMMEKRAREIECLRRLIESKAINAPREYSTLPATSASYKSVSVA